MADDNTQKNQGTTQGPASAQGITPGAVQPVTSAQAAQAQVQGSVVSAPAIPSPPTASTPTQPVILPPSATPPLKKVSLNLEDEALMAQQQGVVAPPDKYAVPSMVKEKFPDLVQLIKETESMNDEERDYWFQILPIMTEEQIRKFRDILLNEKNQLKKLDKEYEQELNKLNEKHMLEWKEFEMREKRKAIQTAESKSKEEEAGAEEELLRRLSQH